jgi:hypothetical protein
MASSIVTCSAKPVNFNQSRLLKACLIIWISLHEIIQRFLDLVFGTFDLIAFYCGSRNGRLGMKSIYKPDIYPDILSR